MVALYIPVLCLSAWLAAYALLRVTNRFYKLLGLRYALPAGVFVLVSTLAFLVIVAAPAPVIVGAMLLGGMQMKRVLPPIAHWGLPLIAAMFAASTVHLPTIAHVPPMALQCLALIGIFAVTMAGHRLPDGFTPCSSSLLLTLAPLLAAPFLGAHGSVALDVGLIASAILGAAMASGTHAAMGLARLPLALITGWLMVEATAGTGYIATALSLLVYGGVIAFGATRDDEAHDAAL